VDGVLPTGTEQHGGRAGSRRKSSPGQAQAPVLSWAHSYCDLLDAFTFPVEAAHEKKRTNRLFL